MKHTRKQRVKHTPDKFKKAFKREATKRFNKIVEEFDRREVRKQLEEAVKS